MLRYADFLHINIFYDYPYNYVPGVAVFWNYNKFKSNDTCILNLMAILWNKE